MAKKEAIILKPKKVKKITKKSLVAKTAEAKGMEIKDSVRPPASVSWQGNQPGYYKRSGWWYLIASCNNCFASLCL